MCFNPYKVFYVRMGFLSLLNDYISERIKDHREKCAEILSSMSKLETASKKRVFKSKQGKRRKSFKAMSGNDAAKKMCNEYTEVEIGHEEEKENDLCVELILCAFQDKNVAVPNAVISTLSTFESMEKIFLQLKRSDNAILDWVYIALEPISVHCLIDMWGKASLDQENRLNHFYDAIFGEGESGNHYRSIIFDKKEQFRQICALEITKDVLGHIEEHQI